MANQPGVFPDSSNVDPTHVMFDGLPVPVCLVDSAGDLVAMNRAAVAFWGREPEGILGEPAMQALGIVPSDGGGDAWARLSPSGARPRLRCRVATGDGQIQSVSIIYSALAETNPALGVLFIIAGPAADVLSDLPEWALRDPVTGLGNRHLWEREVPNWSSLSGCIAFFDLDDLKEVNDLHGHVAGDWTLAAVGQALSAIVPSGALIVRYGGDEFVVVVPDDDEAAVETWARGAVHHVASSAPSADLPIVPRLSHGVAAFGPGGLREAVQRADDILYERKGVLLPAASGGRIILTRDGRTALRGPGDDRAQPLPGTFSSGFAAEFEGYFRMAFAHAVEQAQDFVEFVGPQPGEAVVEVGAGAGRITFDGGLAQRIGPSGQLLVTDPSGPQLLEARRKATALDFSWVRFLRAPAEDLPIASNTVDLVLGSTFLHFTDPVRALREMARVVRPGGRVAICNPLEFTWPAVWLEILEPVREESARHGLPLRHFLPPDHVLRRHVEASGLQITHCRVLGPDYMDFPGAEIALAFWRQATIVPLLLRGLPAERHAAVQESFEVRV